MTDQAFLKITTIRKLMITVFSPTIHFGRLNRTTIVLALYFITAYNEASLNVRSVIITAKYKAKYKPNRQSNKHKTNMSAAVEAGLIAGIISGMVKIGWEALLPPRTPARDNPNPPQHLLEQLHLPSRLLNASYTYSKQQMPIAGFLMHFGFSTTFAVAYALAGQRLPKVKAGHGVVFGLGVWAAYHLYLLPKMHTIPAAKDQPLEEHVSEALGHAMWMWTNDVFISHLYQSLNHKQ